MVTAVGVRHPTCRAFKRKKLRQSAKPFCSSNERHRLRAIWTTRRLGYRFVTRVIEHG